MVAMCTIMAILLHGPLCTAESLGLVTGRKLHDIEEWVYSKKVVIIDILVNMIIVSVSMLFLACTMGEIPDSDFPVRVWLGLYSVHCFVHVILVWVEYRHGARRMRRRREADSVGFVVRSFAYKCDVWNLWTLLVWQIVGLCWIPAPSHDKLLWQSAPWLYRLTMIFLTNDVMFFMLCLVGIVVCFSLSLVISIVYAVVGQKQENASKANLSLLPKYRFHMSSNGEKPSVGAGVMVPMDTVSGDSATECDLLPEGTECRICLCSYDDGMKLHALSCNHRFHATCIEQWLNINATCPVCDYNTLKRDCANLNMLL